MENFVIQSDRIEGRLDPNFYASQVVLVKNRLKTLCGDHKFGEVIDDIYRYPTFYGFEYQTSGIPVIKGENIDESGFIDSNQDFDCITEVIHERFHRTQLKKNDLLFTVRGIIGKVGLFDGFVSEANINANLIKITIKKEYDSRFFWIYLNSSIGQTLIQNLTSGQVQKTITVPDIKNILIPLPSPDIQSKVVGTMQSAYTLKRQKEADAQELTDSIDAYILSELGVTLFSESDKSCFTVDANFVEGRLDPHFYRPEFRDIEEKLLNLNSKRLEEIITISNETWNQQSVFTEQFPYIEIGEIDLTTGEINNVHYYDVKDAPSRARMIVKENDIIVSMTRPSRGAISLINNSKDGFIASTGFAVLRELKSDQVYRAYLFYVLRTKLCLMQMLQRSSGGNYPAITLEELKKILIPVPAIDTQKKISKGVQSRIRKIKELLQEATSILEKATSEVDKIVLG